jgi:hypothetical protein
MARQEREILEHAVHAVTEQAAKADDLVDLVLAAGAGASDPIVVHAKFGHVDDLGWSSDGSRLAFNGLYGSGVWIVGVDGSGLTEVPKGAQPQWSPAGSRLAFQLQGDLGHQRRWLWTPTGSSRWTKARLVSGRPPHRLRALPWHARDGAVERVARADNRRRRIWSIDRIRSVEPSAAHPVLVTRTSAMRSSARRTVMAG